MSACRSAALHTLAGGLAETEKRWIERNRGGVDNGPRHSRTATSTTCQYSGHDMNATLVEAEASSVGGCPLPASVDSGSSDRQAILAMNFDGRGGRRRRVAWSHGRIGAGEPARREGSVSQMRGGREAGRALSFSCLLCPTEAAIIGGAAEAGS